MKKGLPLVVVVFTLVFAVLALAGCGGKSQPANQSTGTQSAKEESVADLFAKGNKIDGMSYDYFITSKDSSMSGKIWMQGKKMKTEGVFDGQKVVSIIDGDTNTYITYNPAENKAMKITSAPTEDKIEKPTDFTSDIDTTKVKVLETTVYEGMKCKVVEMLEKEGQVQIKMWVSVDYGIPVRVEVADPQAGKTVMEYKNVKVGSISADVFQLPAVVEVTDMSDMMKNMPQMPNMPKN